jgi:hypothetical protein
VIFIGDLLFVLLFRCVSVYLFIEQSKHVAHLKIDTTEHLTSFATHPFFEFIAIWKISSSEGGVSVPDFSWLRV